MDKPAVPSPEDVTSKYPVSCFIPEVASAISGGAMNHETETLLEDYNGFHLGDHVERYGVKVVQEMVTEAQGIYDGFCADMPMEKRVERIVARILEYQPGFDLPSFPISFIYAGRHMGGRSMVGTHVVINLGDFVDQMRRKNIRSMDEVYAYIEDTLVHEGIHMLSFALGNGIVETRVPCFDSIWNEGLASLPERTRSHNGVEGDTLRFWIGLLEEWRKAESYDERILIVGRHIDPAINSHVNERDLRYLKKQLDQGKSLESAFIMLLEYGRVLYELGLLLWKDRIARGEEIPTLLREGPESLETWVREYAERMAV